MLVAPSRRAFLTLDGLRGVGAFLVVMRHVPALFGPIRVPESFLAVDLFYLVSGFVVAHAYGARLKAGGFLWDFFKTRVIRLYPLYALGLAIGLVVAVLAVMRDPHGWWTVPKIVEAVVTGIFLIPYMPGITVNGSTLDGPVWTLLPELIANMVYAAFIRFMTLPVLVAIVLVSGVGVISAELIYGTLDVGYGGTDQWAALARVGYSFFVGVLLFRFFGEHRTDNEFVSWGAVAVLAGLLAYQPTEAQIPYYELGVVLAGFPALLVVAGRFEPGPATGRAFSYIGLVSYGVYSLHQPLGNLVRDVLQRHALLPHDVRSLGYGVVFLAGLVFFSGWLDRHFDGPVRKRLRARFLDRKPVAVAV